MTLTPMPWGLLAVMALGGLVGCGGATTGSSGAGDRAAAVVSGNELRQSCGFAFAPDERFLRGHWKAGVVTVGPVRFLGAKARVRPNLAGPRVWKLPTLTRPGRAVTVSVEGRAPRAMGFVRPGPHQRPLGQAHSSVVLEGCPPVAPEIRFPGAGADNAIPLFVVVRRNACVRIAVRRAGGAVRRAALPMGAAC